MQETQSYQRFQCIGHTDFKGLSNAVTNTHPLLPSMGTTRQKSSCRNRLQNGPRLLSRVKAGTHSPSPTGSHTAAYTPKQGPSFPRPQRGFALSVKSILFRHAFIYIHFPVLCDHPLSATALSQTIFHRVFQLSSQTAHVCLHPRKRVHTRLSEKDSHTTAHTAKQGRFGWGRYYYPRTVPHVLETLRGQMSERQTLPLLGLGRVCSRRTQKAFGTAMRMMRVAVPRRRGPARLRDLFRFCRNCGLYALRSGPFRVCEARGGIVTLSVLCVLLKHRTAACKSG